MTTLRISHCQSCSSPRLQHVINLGYLPPVNRMYALDKRPSVLETIDTPVVHCLDCGLVQLEVLADSATVFPNDYPYTSGMTQPLVENFRELAQEAIKIINPSSDDFVVDIGSNDGTLLSFFQKYGQRVLGIEPTETAEIANKNGIRTLHAPFSEHLARQIPYSAHYGRPRIVTATNVFAHIPNINDITKAIENLLAPGGVFISESHYLYDLLEKTQFDAIYHEHLRYYSMKALRSLLERHGLEIFHVRRIPTHGGSIRVYAARKGDYEVRDSVREMLAAELVGTDLREKLKMFAGRTRMYKRLLLDELQNYARRNRKVFGIGAPSRASTLLSYLGVDETLMQGVAEQPGSLKIGKCMPGTRIPIMAEADVLTNEPDILVILSWHLKDQIAKSLRAKGFKGVILAPLPQPHHL